MFEQSKLHTPRVVVAIGVAWLGSFACGGERFRAAPNGAAGNTSGGGVGGASGADAGSSGTLTAGEGGSAGASAGAGGAAGSAGAAGRGGNDPGCTCPASQYCRAGVCFECSDLSSFEFGAAEEILGDDDDNLRFPRAGAGEASLFFRRGEDAAARLWHSDDYAASAPVALDPAATLARSGLVYLGDGGTREFNVLFDERDDAGQRSIRRARFDSELTNVSTLGSPLSPSGFDVYSVAFAVETERAYWMSVRDGAVALRTGALGSGDETPVELLVPARSGGTCPRVGADATPWVTSNGRLLLFRAPPLAVECQPIDGDRNDLYAVPLDAGSGLALGSAVAFDAVNQSGADDTDPSLSPDLCSLYFASNAEGGAFKLYRAPRR